MTQFTTKATNKVDRFAARLADVVIRWRWLVIAMAVMAAALAGSGARFLEFSNNYRTFFSPENLELMAFEKLQATYTKNDNILFVVQSPDSIFRPQMAEAIEWLTQEAWQIPYTIRVDSVTNFQHSAAEGDDLSVDDLIRNGGELSPGELADRRRVALAEPLLNGNLISPDTATTGVNVTLQYPEESLTEVPEAAAYARGLAAQLKETYPDVTVAISGVSMLNNAFAESGMMDSMTLIRRPFIAIAVCNVATFVFGEP